ncbi:MAG TPA: efflux RND transporter periplasmic adaptor subunit, partial [Candidatus Angelobacter sp.]
MSEEDAMPSSEENVTTTSEPESIQLRTPEASQDGLPPRPKINRRKGTLLLTAPIAAIGLLIYSGIHSRAAAESRLKQRTEDAAIPTVAVVFPKEGAATQEIILPGNTQAFSDAPIYARTNGYLKQWHFDIGAHVQKGQLLAEIETPEIDQQLQQAQAELDTAQANLNIAKITAARWQGLVSDGSVSQQETDQAVSNLSAVKATAESSAANMRRLEQLQSFEKIYAPFDGIITARNTDVGALIDA